MTTEMTTLNTIETSGIVTNNSDLFITKDTNDPLITEVEFKVSPKLLFKKLSDNTIVCVGFVIGNTQIKTVSDLNRTN